MPSPDLNFAVSSERELSKGFEGLGYPTSSVDVPSRSINFDWALCKSPDCCANPGWSFCISHDFCLIPVWLCESHGPFESCDWLIFCDSLLTSSTRSPLLSNSLLMSVARKSVSAKQTVHSFK